MKQPIKTLIFLFALIFILIIPYFVFAGALDNLKMVGGIGYQRDIDEFTVGEVAGLIVATLFSILGIVFTFLMLYGGYNWMIAAGDNSKVEKAKDTIKRAIIGLIIIFASWAIASFVLARLFINYDISG